MLETSERLALLTESQCNTTARYGLITPLAGKTYRALQGGHIH